MHTHSLQRTHTQTVLYKYLWRLSQQIIEIDKVIVGARAWTMNRPSLSRSTGAISIYIRFCWCCCTCTQRPGRGAVTCERRDGRCCPRVSPAGLRRAHASAGRPGARLCARARPAGHARRRPAAFRRREARLPWRQIRTGLLPARYLCACAVLYSTRLFIFFMPFYSSREKKRQRIMKYSM